MKDKHRILHRDFIRPPAKVLIRDPCPLGKRGLLSVARMDFRLYLEGSVELASSNQGATVGSPSWATSDLEPLEAPT